MASLHNSDTTSAPGVTIEAVLELTTFRRANARLRAGTRNATNEVRWIQYVELEDVTRAMRRWLRGGELVVARDHERPAHNASPTLAREWRRYLKEVAQAEAAGVVIEVVDGDLDRSILSFADELGLPLITIGQFATIELAEELQGMLFSRELRLLRSASQASDEVLQLLARGGGIEEIVAWLGRAISACVVLENEAHQVVAYEAFGLSSLELLDVWAEHSRHGHSTSLRSRSHGLVREFDIYPECWWAPISIQGQPHGRLHALQLSRPLDEPELITIKSALPAISLALAQRQPAAELVHKERASLLLDAVQGIEPAELFSRSRAIGVDFGHDEVRALAITVPHVAPSILVDLESAVERAAVGHDCAALVALHDAGVLVLAADRDDALLGWLPAAVEAALPQLAGRLRVSAGSRVPLERARQTLDEATTTAVLAHAGAAPPGATSYDELGVSGLLIRLRDDPALPRFVERHLGPILDHDSRHRNTLLPTLRAYLRSSGQKSDIARALILTRRSVYLRLDRIEAILGVDLDGDPEARERLAVALRALDLLGAGRLAEHGEDRDQ